jgi:hypothetical protein
MRLLFILLIALAFAGTAVAEQVPETPVLTGPNFQQVPASDILVKPTGGAIQTLGDALSAPSGDLTNGSVTATGGTTKTLGNWFINTPSGLGTMAAQNATAVAITGGTLNGSLGLTTASPASVASTTTQPGLRITGSDTFTTTASHPGIVTHNSFFGTVNSGSANWYSFSIDTDKVAASAVGGATGFNIAMAPGQGATGGRNGLAVVLAPAQDNTSGSGAGTFQVSMSGFSHYNYWWGGSPGDERGSLFGSNPSARALQTSTIGTRGFRGVVGEEVDFGNKFPVLAKHGLDVTEWSTSASFGKQVDYSIGIVQQPGGTAPGVDKGIAFGNPFSSWPIRATGQMISTHGANLFSGAPAATAAVGINFSDVALSQYFELSTGYAVSGAGNVGGQTVTGKALQTRDGISAKTAVVNTIASVQGGRFTTIPSLVIDAPPTSGSTATAHVATMGIDSPQSIVGGKGTGYTVGDVLTLSGGTCGTAPQFVVGAVNSGVIVDLDVQTVGSCSVLPASPVTLTGGTGTGATVTPNWTILTVTVDTAGTNYLAYPPPAVVPTGGTLVYQPLLVASMTASNATLPIQPAGGGLTINGTAAVSCGAGTVNLATFIVTNGIVTHC